MSLCDDISREMSNCAMAKDSAGANKHQPAGASCNWQRTLVSLCDDMSREMLNRAMANDSAGAKQY